jgi:hypothetical protein
MNKILLSVQNLKTVFYMRKQAAPAVGETVRTNLPAIFQQQEKENMERS